MEDIRAAITRPFAGTTIQSTEEYRLPDNASYMLSKKLSDLATTGARTFVEQEVLSSLCFRFMHARQESVPEAHQDTFDWVYQPQSQPSPTRKSATLYDWLLGGDGIYWISGKAGSGKSTLMKLLVSQRRTTTVLSQWASPQECVSAGFFFWSLGTELQKTQEGLLRSLLFEVLRQRPELMPAAYLRRTLELQGAVTRDTSLTWTLAQLQKALRDVTRHSISPKFCLFIDGLDEYEGDHGEIMNYLKDLASSSNIKLCVSSRPWNVFEDGLGKDPALKIYMQDLTRQDINTYVRSKLSQHAHFPLVTADGSCHDRLVEEITQKAQGVFLWVFLVTRSLVEGLTNGDTLSALELRVRHLPTDLEQYFTHMLKSVDHFYYPQMANTFLAALQAPSPLPLMLYSFLDDIVEAPDGILKLPIKGMERAEIFARHQQMRRRINSRCKGLLEIYPEPRGIDPDTSICVAFRVDFFHRTVKDFLNTMKMTGFLRKHALGINTNAAIFRAFVALIKNFPVHGPHDMGAVSDLLYDAFRCAYLAELQTNTSQVDVLDELEYTLKAISFSRRSRGPWHHGCDGRPLFTFLEFAIVNGLDLSTRARVAQRLDSDDSVQQDTLLGVVLAPPLYGGRDQPDLTGILSYLLGRRSQPIPNRLWDSYLLQTLYAIHSPSGPPAGAATSALHRCRTIELLLSHGAPPGVQSTSPLTWRNYSLLPIWAQFLFRASFSTPASPELKDAYCRIISAFLRAGANPNELRPDRGLTIWALFCRDLFTPPSVSAGPAVELQVEKLEIQARLLGMLIEFGADLSAVADLRTKIVKKFPQARLSDCVLEKMSKAVLIKPSAQAIKSQSMPTQSGFSRLWSRRGRLLLGNMC